MFDDFIVDDHAWTIRYRVIDTRNWLPGKKILVAAQWIATVDWKNSNVYVNLSREAIKSGPEFNPNKLDREYETLSSLNTMARKITDDVDAVEAGKLGH